MIHCRNTFASEPSPDLPDDAEDTDPEMPDNTETDE